MIEPKRIHIYLLGISYIRLLKDNIIILRYTFPYSLHQMCLLDVKISVIRKLKVIISTILYQIKKSPVFNKWNKCSNAFSVHSVCIIFLCCLCCNESFLVVGFAMYLLICRHYLDQQKWLKSFRENLKKAARWKELCQTNVITSVKRSHKKYVVRYITYFLVLLGILYRKFR